MQQTPNAWLALTSTGIESLLLTEITDLGGQQVKQSINQVAFHADLSTAYRVCLWSRLATRLLKQLFVAELDDSNTLYDAIYSFDWTQYLSVDSTFLVDFVGTNQEFNDSRFAALRVKDAIVDQFQHRYEERPNVDKQYPDCRIQVRLNKQSIQVLVDYSGPSLHQRGYRSSNSSAPLKEHLAAALVIRSGWLKQPLQPLVDPFCGSGTILIEAALLAQQIAPGLFPHDYAFEQLPDFDSSLWRQLKQDAKQQQRTLKLALFGSDQSYQQIQAAKQHSKHSLIAPIQWKIQPIEQLRPPTDSVGILLTNAPYGERLGDWTETAYLYAQFGLRVKQVFQGWQLWFLTAKTSPISHLKLAKSKAYTVKNGPLVCQLLSYPLSEKQCEIQQATSTQAKWLLNETQDFVNRLKKNIKSRRQYAKQQQTTAFRLYDADLPNFNLAIDCYADQVIVYEYAPPKEVDPLVAEKRRDDSIIALIDLLDISPKQVHLKVRQQQKGEQQYQKLKQQQQVVTVQEGQALFSINMTDYLDCGLFLDHRIVRQQFAAQCHGQSVLNLFSYTGSVSVHAALQGARQITSVDMSRTYLDWAQKNYELNQLDRPQDEFIQADVLQWLAQERQDYDRIFLDPPTFSNSKRMLQHFDIQRDHIELLTQTSQRLTQGGLLYFSTNFKRFKLDTQALQDLGLKAESLTMQTLPQDFKQRKPIRQCWLITQL